MKKIFIYIYVFISIVFISCAPHAENAERVRELPSIFPDYIDVTIPVDIAPLDFNMTDESVEYVDVTVKGSKGGEISSRGEYADFDIDEWHSLTEQNKGGKLFVSVSARKQGKWYQYDDFTINVSQYPLDDYGITYRLIAPGYEVGGNIGIYQRDLHSFEETTLLQQSAIPGQCMNCHTSNRGNADQYMMHIRGDKSGTLIMNNGTQTWLTTKTDSTKANCSYSYWHPSGNYIASSANAIFQLFYVKKERRIEVFDTMSDVLVIDTRTNQLLLNPLLQSPDWLETYPVFSADGKTLYFCTAQTVKIPDEYDKIHYSLCKIGFDAATGTYGNHVDTVFNAIHDSLSYTFPRPSYDGRWLMYSVLNYGNFPVNHKESELWLMNLHTGEARCMTEVNSDDSESFHNWNTTSHWFVFSSRRGDSMYNKAYISSIDDKGRATKPFLLPQRNPLQFYREQFYSYNCPDFVNKAVDFDAIKASETIMSGQSVQVTIK